MKKSRSSKSRYITEGQKRSSRYHKRSTFIPYPTNVPMHILIAEDEPAMASLLEQPTDREEPERMPG